MITRTPSHLADVGGTTVRRALPRHDRRTVGAWCFLDHFGPSERTTMEIGPHPHIGLQTVTWLVQGELLHRDDMLFNLYRWRELGDDQGVELKAWLDEQLQHDEVLIHFAKALTGESWTTGMGGFGSLGDRVSRRQVRAQISDSFDLFDPTWFRGELDRIVQEKRHPQDDLEAVSLFLDAWARRRGGHND